MASTEREKANRPSVIVSDQLSDRILGGQQCSDFPRRVHRGGQPDRPHQLHAPLGWPVLRLYVREAGPPHRRRRLEEPETCPNPSPQVQAETSSAESSRSGGNETYVDKAIMEQNTKKAGGNSSVFLIGIRDDLSHNLLGSRAGLVVEPDTKATVAFMLSRSPWKED
ncbi:hypothetical protein Acr_06g0001900 [Actinidia rufa]|uniref:Uncharacterized protein n=1 Tax=Actinidia rufa TaxID=165716 RepID=A0A7J0EPM1_9ERIC|nr:hypothetical protein Acr_06g0001900 [Actinidia rufa]